MRTALGAYGFIIDGLDGGSEHLREAPEDWPRLRIRQQAGVAPEPLPPGTVRIEDDRAEIWLGPGDRIELDRETLTVLVVAREPYSAEALLHPLLGLPASIASHWLGRRAFHGGSFLHAGHGWALLGEREAGKSATLGQLLRDGHAVLSDDILVYDGTTLFAGPRTVDLRAEPAERLGGEHIGIVGNRPRWRLRPEDSAASAPAGGFVHLEWGDETRLEAIAPEDRLRGLIASIVLRPGEPDALGLLELAALPAWRFVRRPGLDGLPAATAQLLAALNQAV